jgi:hypothetical protein
MSYKPTFGIKYKHKRSKAVKSEKGDSGIGFKLTHDNNYDMDNKRLTNIHKPTENKDTVNEEYFFDGLNRLIESFHWKNEDVDINNKAIKNLSWPNDMMLYLKNICIRMDCCWIIKLRVLMHKIKNCKFIRSC